MEITGNLAFKPDTSHAIVGLVYSGFYSPRGLHVTWFLFRGGELSLLILLYFQKHWDIKGSGGLVHKGNHPAQAQPCTYAHPSSDTGGILPVWSLGERQSPF